MKRFIISIFTLSCSLAVNAKDFGVVAPLFPIIEQSWTAYVYERLEQLQQKGRLDELKQMMKEKVSEQVNRPASVVNFTTTDNPKSYLVDPSLTLGVDIKDDKGNVIYPKGLTINPFDPTTFPNGYGYQVNFSKSLVFLDADDSAQIAWLHRYLSQETMATKVIVTNGSPFELEKQIDQRVYFEQSGDLARKFHISHLPVTVKQDGKHWRVTEFDPYRIEAVGVSYEK